MCDRRAIMKAIGIDIGTGVSQVDLSAAFYVDLIDIPRQPLIKGAASLHCKNFPVTVSLRKDPVIVLSISAQG